MAENDKLIGVYTDLDTGKEVRIDPLPTYDPLAIAITNGDGPLALFIQRLADQAITAEDARAERDQARNIIDLFLSAAAPARRGRPPAHSAKLPESPPAALTKREEEALRLFWEHGRNLTAAAKAARIKRQPFTRRLEKAFLKLDTIAARHRQVQALPTDEDGQITVADVS